MTTWPILSVVTFLPVVGALLIYISRGDDEAARRNSRWRSRRSRTGTSSSPVEG